jgi:tetratricopeptide (TPR) repeat protein
VSPHSDYARAVLIEKDWERARPHLAEWKKAADRSPVLLAALARKYSEQGRVEDARRSLSRYIRFSPDHWAYEMLAGGFKDAGDVDRWRSTLDEFLVKTKGEARTRAGVRIEIAECVIVRGDWDKAWPYAEIAAATGIYRALVCAARCAEGRKDWGAAEGYNRLITERNPGGGWAAWYLFCKRSGHGDAEAAGAFAAGALAPGGPGARVAPPASVGYFRWLRGDPKTALTDLRKAYDAAPSAMTCIPLILVADELGDAVSRDEWIRTLTTRHRDQSPNSARIFEIPAKPTGPGQPDATDLKAVDQILDTIRVAASRGNNEFFVGCFLKNRGKAEEARRHLEQALRSTSSHRFMRAIAADQLQRLGVDIKAIGAGPGMEDPEARR